MSIFPQAKKPKGQLPKGDIHIRTSEDDRHLDEILDTIRRGGREVLGIRQELQAFSRKDLDVLKNSAAHLQGAVQELNRRIGAIEYRMTHHGE